MIADSCFIIDLLGGDKSAIKLFNEQRALLVPTIVITEVSRGVFDTQSLLSFLTSFIIVDIDTNIALDAAQLLQKNDKKGTRVDICDAIVAACARKYGEPVVTRNEKHFERLDVNIETY